ncbi:MAG TPA: hypothetical protein VHU84_19450 [Lacipirellulaceae bacterium]|nr:hypothetical protein [Lacipirellulaceae bacterium]
MRYRSCASSTWWQVINISLLSLGICGYAAAKPATPPREIPTATLELLRDAGGELTPTVRASYVDWAKGIVLGQLSAAKFVVPDDALHEIEASPTMTDAVFASVSPPDKTILENFVELRTKLGPAFVQKYRSLVVAAAVGHRKNGVSSRDLSEDVVPDAEDLEVGSELPEPDVPTKEEAPDELAGAVAEFMKSTHSSALEIFDQPMKQQQLREFLKSRNVSPKAAARVDEPKALGRALKSAMVVLGQRPAKRQPRPDVATWLKYLASVYESSPTIPPVNDKDPKRWPLFPIDRAPWPLLMPLSRPMPLDEARYIYEKFEGEHGKDRYHTYGPYRKWEGELRASLVPSPWHWGAWPDRIMHGGVCTTMSGIAIDTHRALCQPALPAGQPHHSNLMSYHNSDGQWSAHIDQAFAGGPAVTHALWMFNDVKDGPARLIKKGEAGAEYNLGLGAAMNVGLRSYIDSRIAVHLYRALSDSEKPTIGAKLLAGATKANGFNPQPWYLLAEQTKTATEGLPLARAVFAHVPSPEMVRAAKDEKKIEHKLKVKKLSKPSAAEVAQREYWDTVAKFVARTAIERHGTPTDEKEARAVKGFLQAVGQPLTE